MLDAAPLSRDVLGQYTRFENEMAIEERELVGNPLQWNEQERELGQWIRSAYRVFAAVAATLLRRLTIPGSGPSANDDAAGNMAAMSLAASGSAIKWAEIGGSGRRNLQLAEAHKVYALVDDHKLGGLAATVPFLGDKNTLTLTALYARALLLDVLCRGNLTRQQAAILDGWLREWAGAYPLVRGPASGAHLHVGPAARRGRRPSLDSQAARVLDIEPMATQIEMATAWFHEGRIFPGYGIVSELRVEEHVAVLDILRDFLEAARKGMPERPAREERTAPVELLVGLTEILSKGFKAPAADDGSDAYLPSPVAPAFGTQLERRPARSAIDTRFEVKVRMLRLVDESAGGLGLEGEDGEQPLEVGTLIAVRRSPTAPALLCEIVRRIAPADAPVRLGSRILSRDLNRVELLPGGAKAPIHGLFVAGDDSSGRADAILIAASDYDAEKVYELIFVQRVYRVRLNRIRHRGRGWLLAGLEVVDARASEESVSIDSRD